MQPPHQRESSSRSRNSNPRTAYVSPPFFFPCPLKQSRSTQDLIFIPLPSLPSQAKGLALELKNLLKLNEPWDRQVEIQRDALSLSPPLPLPPLERLTIPLLLLKQYPQSLPQDHILFPFLDRLFSRPPLVFNLAFFFPPSLFFFDSFPIPRSAKLVMARHFPPRHISLPFKTIQTRETNRRESKTTFSQRARSRSSRRQRWANSITSSSCSSSSGTSSEKKVVESIPRVLVQGRRVLEDLGQSPLFPFDQTRTNRIETSRDPTDEL